MELSVVTYEDKVSRGKGNHEVGGGGGRYKECMRNHAAAMGRQSYDGCGEFMSAGEIGTLEALKCAACGCHRNFHRREDHFAAAAQPAFFLAPPPPTPPLLLPAPLPYRQLPPPPPKAATREGSETPPSAADVSAQNSQGKKRSRTKFTVEQKERMLAFAERVGWRIQRHDDGELEAFCCEVGVTRHVLKVWMHNNKHAHVSPPSPSSAAAVSGEPKPPEPRSSPTIIQV